MSLPATVVPTCPPIVVVDADRRIRQSLVDVLRVAGGVEVVGSAGDVRTALSLIEQQRPAIVVVDPRLPDLDAGLALFNSIGLAWPSIRIVATGWVDAFDHPALAAHANAFVAKSASPEEFVRAIVNACTDEP